MSHSNEIREPASRKFTDREKPKSRFEQALTPQPDGTPVLVWYGVGGQGKTALRNEFQDLLRPLQKARKIGLGVLDFDSPLQRNPIDAMLQLRFELGARGRLKFPFFEIAFTQLFALEHPGEDIRQRYPRLFQNRESELLTDLLELAGDTGVLRVATEVATDIATEILGVQLLYKYGTRLVGWAREWWALSDVKREIGDIQRLHSNTLRECLPAYLGKDLVRAIAAPDAPRVILMLDAYEALWRDAPRGALENLRTDNWVRSLVEHAPGTLVVIFCRDKLRWGELSPRWNTLLEQHLLGGLSDQDAVSFLTEAGIRSGAIRDRVIKAAQGLPFYLDLALDQFEHVTTREQRAPVPEDFGETPGEVLERFRDHLSDTEIEDLELASYLEVLDERLLVEVSKAICGRRADWARLAQRSYMTRDTDGCLRMHRLMRELSQARERRVRPRFYQEAHQFLFERFDAHVQSVTAPRDIREEHEHALIEAARHLAATDPPRLPQWIMQRQKTFAEAARWLTLAHVFELIEDAVGSLPAGGRQADAVWFYHHHAHIRQYMGDYVQAKALYERALQNYPQDAVSTSHYATILDALGNVCWEMGDLHEAEQLYSRAKQIYDAAPAAYPPRHAYVVFNLARCHDRNGRKDEAEVLYRKARDLFQAIGAQLPREVAGFLLDLARIRRGERREDEALVLLKKALAFYSRPDGHPSSRAVALLEVAECFAARGDRASARTQFGEAVLAHESAFGPEHPNLGRALHRQAAFWLTGDSRVPEAAPQFARAVDILSESLGDGHIWTKEARADLRRVQQAGFAAA